jgi:hypothetical protein
MNPSSDATLDKYMELLHSNARQLLYNIAIDISGDNPDMSYEEKCLMAEIEINEWINVYTEAKRILSNPTNFGILQEEALANGMLKDTDFAPPEYPHIAQSEGSISPFKGEFVSPIEEASPSGHARFKAKPHMSVRPQPTIPLGFMPTPGMNLDMEDSTSYDSEEFIEEENC